MVRFDFNPKQFGRLGFALAGLLAASCTGSIEMMGAGAGTVVDPGAAPANKPPQMTGTGGAGGTTQDPPPPTGIPSAVCKPSVSVSTPIRRLSRREYNNTVADLIGDKTAPAAGFPPELITTGFDTAADASMLNEGIVDNYLDAAQVLAQAGAANLPALLGCDPATKGEDVCAGQFITGFGRRAFRRPLTPEEQGRYQALYAATKKTAGFATSIELVLRAFLLAPQFMYRVETGNQPGPRPGLLKPTPYEMATRLSYFIWGSAPDDELLAAADAGRLATAEQVAAQAQRLLAHDNGGRLIRSFYGQLLGLGRLADLSRGPLFSARLASAMQQEIDLYFDTMIRKRKATWPELLTSPVGFVNTDSAPVYGMSGVSGLQLREIARPADRYRGFLTMPAFLTMRALPNQGSPILRGKFIREKILCQHIPDPPPNVDTKLAPADATTTARQILEAKTQTVQPCMTCHTLLNPPGFAFGNFDQIGAWNVTDAEKRNIETGGSLEGTDVDGTFKGHLDLIDKLAKSEETASCVGKVWFRYAMARMESVDDGCIQRDLLETFKASKGDIQQVLLKLVTTDAFLYR